MQLGNLTVNGYADMIFDPQWDAYDDLYLVLLFKIASTTTGNGLSIALSNGSWEVTYGFGDAPTYGDILHTITLGVWYAYVLPFSEDFFDIYEIQLALESLRLEFNTNTVAYVKWLGIFRASAFSDDYCINCRCGKANNVDSGIRDTDDDDVYLKTTNSDLQITEDIVVDSNNAKLTIYGTLGEGMRCKVTISWEISSVPQTDKVLYADSLPYAFDLDIECPSIDKVTNIKIENILAP